MSKHHSTLSRRDFLKLLGLGGVGLGAAAVSVPVIHDLDELMASPGAEGKKPWYVREVDKPTCEINWEDMERFNAFEVMWAGGLRKAIGPEQLAQVFKVAAQNKKQWILENRPGQTLKDVALRGADNWAPLSRLGPRTSPTPEDLGVPRYEGTPEENIRIVRAFLRLHGASHVSAVELDTNTTEKLIYSYDTAFDQSVQGPRLDILDVDEPSEHLEEGYWVMPKKARYVIDYTLRMSDELMTRPLTQLGNRSHMYMYNLRSLIQGQLQNFLRTLGYMGLGEENWYTGMGISPGFAVMSGLGELSRMGHIITPEYGLRQRVFKLITDLPLAPGKPIDFGAMRFCKTCKKCAQNCPVQAISHETEPFWDTGDRPYHHRGVRAWHWHQEICNAYIFESNGCAVCHGVCPLSKGGHKAFYHDLQRWTTANTSLFNGFFKGMDDFLDYGWKKDPKEIEGWWDLDLPPWGYVD